MSYDVVINASGKSVGIYLMTQKAIKAHKDTDCHYDNVFMGKKCKMIVDSGPLYPDGNAVLTDYVVENSKGLTLGVRFVKNVIKNGEEVEAEGALDLRLALGGRKFSEVYKSGFFEQAVK